MKNLVNSRHFAIALIAFVSLFAFSSFASAQSKTVKVTFQTGIYRDWDKSWMTTSPQDVIAKITTSKGTSSKSPNSKDVITFNNIPCGESVKINIRFVGTAGYSSNSRDYTKKIGCGKSVVNLGKLEFGKW